MRRDWSTARDFGRFLQKLHFLQPAEPADLSNDDIIPFLNVNTVVTDAQPKKINLTTLKSFVGSGAVGNNTEIQFNDNDSLGASSSLTWDDTAKELGVGGDIKLTDGNIAVPAGSQSAPSVSVGTTDNGIYSPGTDQLALSTNGTGKLFIDSAGKVTVKGVGTAAFVVEGTAPDNSLVVKGSTGNVGIGTSSPDTRLQIGDATVSSFNVIKLGKRVASVQNNLPLIGHTSDNGDDSSLGLCATSSDGSIQFFTGNNSSGFGTGSNNERVRITSTGSVGIGTTTPQDALHIAVPSAVLRLEDTDTNHISTIQSTAAALVLSADATNSVASSYLGLSVDGSERARIDSAGRLLVGTSSALNVEPFVAAQVQTEARYGYTSIYRANDAGGPAFYFIKSRAASAATVVQSEDVLGEIRFQGADGGDYETPGGTIKCEVDGTPGTDDMPGRLVFSVTADGASSPTEALRISNNRAITVSDGGNVVLGTTTGTKIGTTTTQKLGFYNATPVVQPAAVADATDAATVITQLNDLLAKLRTLGIIAT